MLPKRRRWNSYAPHTRTWHGNYRPRFAPSATKSALVKCTHGAGHGSLFFPRHFRKYRQTQNLSGERLGNGQGWRRPQVLKTLLPVQRNRVVDGGRDPALREEGPQFLAAARRAYRILVKNMGPVRACDRQMKIGNAAEEFVIYRGMAAPDGRVLGE